MANKRFEMYEYRQIIFRLRQGETIRSVARSGLADRRKIKNILTIADSHGLLDLNKNLPDDNELLNIFKTNVCSKTPSSIDPYKKQIEEWFHQGIQTTSIHAALQRQYNFAGSYFAIQRFTKSLKNQAKCNSASMILDFKIGECAQVDFGAGPALKNDLGDPMKTWFFVMTLAWSRHLYVEVVLRQDVETWLGCHRRAFEWFGGVPQKIIIDNAKCAITHACYYDPVVQRSYAEFAEGYGFIIHACPPRDPKKKGRVESNIKYVKNNFLPLREFRNLTDINQQAQNWALEIAGNRIHGTTHEKPLTLFVTEKPLLQALPEFPPEIAIWAKVKLHGNCHVQFLKCYYSASYKLLHEVLWLRATDTTVRIYHNHELIAVHPRLTKHGAKHSIDAHLPPQAQAYLMRDPQWCLEQAENIGTSCEQVIQQLLNKSVVDNLHAAQGVVNLQKKYGDARLNAACKRALAFQIISYKAIKNILGKGLEYDPLPENQAFDVLSETYTGKGRFCRNTTTLLQ